MATNVTKTSHFTSGAGNPISFSEISSQFGGKSTNIKASEYLRNEGWNMWDRSTPIPRIPDAKENENITTGNNWNVDSLRDSITEYIVTQSGNNQELSYDNSSTVWNGNLNRSILKKFDVTGTIYANETDKDALTFSGNLYNLKIEVAKDGAIYGEGGTAGGGSGGDALYVNNTYTRSDVEIRSYGKIFAGGGGGAQGNAGNSGGRINKCKNLQYANTTNINLGDRGTNLGEAKPGLSCRRALSGSKWIWAKQNSYRSRCRGGGSRARKGIYQTGRSGNYQCSDDWIFQCKSTNNYSISGGAGGNGGTGGVGQGYSNQSGPGIGNPGNSGNTKTCRGGTSGNTPKLKSKGGDGNPGTSGGKWGVNPASGAGGGSGGKAVKKKNAKVTHYSRNTLKGEITNI